MKNIFKFVVWGLSTVILASCSSNANIPLACGIWQSSRLNNSISSDKDNKECSQLGTFSQWQTIEIFMRGPQTGVTANPNPFLTEVVVTFEGPEGTFVIPAFYDGNGNGNNKGNIWKVRFSPNAIGNWTFTTTSSQSQLDGYTGSFTVEETPKTASDLRQWGWLQYTGEHYLKFVDGDYWLKGGTDDPENILGDALGNWEEKKTAIDYLSSKGVNSVYIITNNIDGDDNDVWPWLGNTPQKAKKQNRRFNIAKLQQWEDFFTYVENKNMLLHIVLDDDSAWHEYDRDLYYREMIARFGHHPAIIWNIGEEANEIYSDQEQIEFAGLLRELDAYDRPVTVHRKSSLGRNWPFLGESNFDLASVQTRIGGENNFARVGFLNLNEIVTENRHASEKSDRPIPIMIDETPAVESVNQDVRFKLRSEVIYPVYLGGGNFELHYRDSNLVPQDLEPMWNDMYHARRFVENLPFQEMMPSNNLLSNFVGKYKYALAQPGVAYGIYLPEGGTVDLDLQDVRGSFQVRWYDVQTGEYRDGGVVEAGGIRNLGVSPFSGDVAIAVTAKEAQN